MYFMIKDKNISEKCQTIWEKVSNNLCILKNI